MPCLGFQTYHHYLPPLPLQITDGSNASIISSVTDKRTQMSAYSLFCLKCIGIFILLNSSRFITKYISDSTHPTPTLSRINDLQLCFTWGLFTTLWHIVLSHNINVLNTKYKYKQIILSTDSDSNYIPKIRSLMHSRCITHKPLHITFIVASHSMLCFLTLQYLSASTLLLSTPFSFRVDSPFCQNSEDIECSSEMTVKDLIRSAFGITYIVIASTLNMYIFDWLLCRRYLPNLTSSDYVQRTDANSLNTPLVSSIREESEMTSVSVNSNVQEIIHIQHGQRYKTSHSVSHTVPSRSQISQIASGISQCESHPLVSSRYNYSSESPLVYSQLLSSNRTSRTTTRTSRTSTNIPTPAPSTFRNITYLGDSESIHQSCVSIWCLDICLAMALMLYFLGTQIIVSGHSTAHLRFERWTLILLGYTSIWRYLMTRIGRMYDALRMFWSDDHRSEYELNSNSTPNTSTTLYLDAVDGKEAVDETEAIRYFISMELVLYCLVMSGYFVVYRVYLVYYEPKWFNFMISVLLHIGSELIENGIKTSTFYFNLTANLYAMSAGKYGHDLCIGNIVALMRDDSSLAFWRDRFAIDISTKMVVSMLSCILALLLYMTECLGYLKENDSAFTEERLKGAALRVGITAVAELVLYVAMYRLWYKGKGFLFEPFTRIITRISGRRRFVWLFMAAFVTAANGAIFWRTK